MEIERSARLQALLQHPSWTELTAVVDEQYAAYASFVTKTVMATGQPPDNIDYKRGFLAGMRHVTRYPGIAEKALERELKAEKEKSE